MLFLAVFAGFLAENQREHYVENLRAKQLAKNLYKEIYARIQRLSMIILMRRSLPAPP